MTQMHRTFEPARRANLGDLATMTSLPKRPGRTSIGPRSLAFCHPNHSKETLEAYFSIYPPGIFVSERDGEIISFLCAIRTTHKSIAEPNVWSDASARDARVTHHKSGDWLYVKRLTYTAGPGHAHLSHEIGPLLTALQEQCSKLDLAGIAFPVRFSGFRERSGTDKFQRSIIDDQHSQERSGLRPLGIAYYVGFRHQLALPNYLGDARHFALMTWER